MAYNIRKILISLLLVFGPLILLTLQQLYGFLPFRENTYDAVWFAGIIIFIMALGFAYQAYSRIDQLRNFIMGFGFLFGLPMIFSAVWGSLDAEFGTDFTMGSQLNAFWFGLDILGSYATDVTLVVQTVTGLIPVGIIVIGVILIFVGDSPDEYATAIIETLLAIGVMILAQLGFGLLGVNIFG